MKIKNEELLSDTPFVAVDLDIMEKNISWLSNLAKKANVKLRPHTKTHKSPFIAQLQIDAGAEGITTATLGEAEVMVDAGITNILIAFPILGKKKLERFKRLHERANLIVALDDIKVAEGLSKVGEKTKNPVTVYIDVDAGFKRMGKSPEESIKSIKEISKLSYINIIGLMSHTGHAYSKSTFNEVLNVAKEEASILNSVKASLKKNKINIQEISVGASATARVIEYIPYITEVRSGMYVFNDRMVMGAGGGNIDDCALTIIATVISQPSSDRLIIDAGSKTLSSDLSKDKGYGKIKGHNNLTIERLSEEHGIVKVNDENTSLQVGSVIEIIPNHVCPVVNLTDELYGFKNGDFEKIIQIAGRGCNR